ncbi:MAG TPA: beta-galactosidase trimerization domain-containing protein [Pirellulales bacterium]|nr:beta-galactosidase trimerization domain-containing protein [Pirellulales bacterium]
MFRCFRFSAVRWIALSFFSSQLHVQLAMGQGGPQYRTPGQPITGRSDGAIVCEAEEFQVVRPGWAPQAWGTNYYAATLANTFLSRKAYLGAAEQADHAVASIDVIVPEAGRYLALVRYEAACRFQTQFTLRVEQQGQARLERLYGARENNKIWAFGNKVKPEVSWPWGAVENVVWEGHDAAVELSAGPARVSLIADRQPEPAAKRNVDLVLLTRDVAEVASRIEKEGYLPLDGLLTQADDIFLKLHNAADGVSMTLTVPPAVEHSPYWVHQRHWAPVIVKAEPGQATDWIEVGSLLDSLNDGQWKLTAAPTEGLHYTVEIGLRRGDDQFEPLGSFECRGPMLELAFQADTRYSRRIRRAEDVLYELVSYLKERPISGAPPRRTPVFAVTFDPKPDNPQYTAARNELIAMFGLSLSQEVAAGEATAPRGYIDVRGQTPEQLDALGRQLAAKGNADKISVVSLGDEIGLQPPPAGEQSGFHNWLKSRQLAPADVDLAAGVDWAKIVFNDSPQTKASNPRLYYYSSLYRHHYGIAQQKKLTEALGRHLPNAGIGANYSPHHGHPYLGETHQWVTLFRLGGMTMPWSEDWIFQVPVGTQQMNFLGLDLFRSGLKGKPLAKIHYYVMPHWPGNTPASWRRQFFGDLGHGMKIVNLFEFRPVQAAYTENHTSLPEMYAEVRRGLYELATFDDIVQDGQVRPGVAALWFSETGDIWDDARDPFAAGKRTLYIAIRQQQLPLDIVTDEDALAGDLKNYRVLYLADQHVSQAAAQAIAGWVAAGGQLFATAGAGMFDEFNAPNRVLRELLGIEPDALEIPEQGVVTFEKQDLPWVEPIGEVQWSAEQPGKTPHRFPVFSARSRFRCQGSQPLGTFSDGTPAVATKATGRGKSFYCGFLPGLSYFRPALPRRPVDRNSAPDSMAHFIPTAFDTGAGELVKLPSSDIARPVLCSQQLVETMVIESPHGVAIPLVNWSGQATKGLTVAIEFDFPQKSVELASGGNVQQATDGRRRTFTFDLEVADALILR